MSKRIVNTLLRVNLAEVVSFVAAITQMGLDEKARASADTMVRNTFPADIDNFGGNTCLTAEVWL